MWAYNWDSKVCRKQSLSLNRPWDRHHFHYNCDNSRHGHWWSKAASAGSSHLCLHSPHQLVKSSLLPCWYRHISKKTTTTITSWAGQVVLFSHSLPDSGGTLQEDPDGGGRGPFNIKMKAGWICFAIALPVVSVNITDLSNWTFPEKRFSQHFRR